jgi:predicted aldo/keto reductase-like oxidoreductase
MKYRKMPRSKDKISALGLGLMRLPQHPDGTIDEDHSLAMLQYALDNGVNYFDTAWGYHDGASEPLLGKFIARSDRSKMLIATKLPCWLVKSRSDMDDFLNKQLERLQTGHIDYYLLHALHKSAWQSMLKLGIIDFLEKAREDGKIRHIGFSFHDKYPVFKQIVNRYEWDFCQFMLNYLDTHYQAGLNGYRLAVEKKMGIIAMEPLRGGKLVQHMPESLEKIWSKSKLPWTPVQRALNWGWNLPGLTVNLSGMSNLGQLKENIRLASAFKPGLISPEEAELYKKARLEYLRRIAIPCSECRYCMPCPHKVAIPAVFGHYNESVMFDQKQRHLQEYRGWIPEESRADKCVQCGECLSKCPQHLDIPSLMTKVAEYFKD